MGILLDQHWKWRTIQTILLSLYLLATIVLLGITLNIPATINAGTDRPLLDGQTFNIWPGCAPGSEGLTLKEEIVQRSTEPTKVNNRFAWKILNPTLTVYLPKKSNGAGILIAPGGGYQRVVLDKEGEEIAFWLTSLGITCFILRYRLPGEGHQQGSDVPLQDAQRAMRIIRKKTSTWGLDPNRLGIMGFSAGGHVASSLGVKYHHQVYQSIDDIDEVNARPDFLILGYPVITMLDEFVHIGSRNQLLGKQPTKKRIAAYSNELYVTKATPQTFIMHAIDDPSVPVENSINFGLALKKARVPVEMHLFKDGGHGFSIRLTQGKTCRLWPELCAEWLKSIGIIK